MLRRGRVSVGGKCGVKTGLCCRHRMAYGHMNEVPISHCRNCCKQYGEVVNPDPTNMISAVKSNILYSEG